MSRVTLDSAAVYITPLGHRAVWVQPTGRGGRSASEPMFRYLAGSGATDERHGFALKTENLHILKREGQT